MRLYSYRTARDRDRIGAVVADGYLGASTLAKHHRWGRYLTRPSIDYLLLLDDWHRRFTTMAHRAVTAGAKPQRDAPGTPLPALQFPGKIVCVGLNYREHVTEGGRDVPDRPILFSKFSNAIVADGASIVRPEGTHGLDLEAELGVVIGRRARRVTADDARSCVAGYVVVNDVSARDWQGIPAALAEGERGDGQWLRAKGSDTYLPMGPVFVTADELDPADGLAVRSWRIPGSGPDAGQEILMQDGNTRDLIWSVPEVIALISRQITLEPGDVIATGTPSGVGVFRDPPVFLEPGDRVRVEVEGIGSVSNPIVDWTEDPRPADES